VLSGTLLRLDMVSYVRGSPGREASARALLARSLIRHYLRTEGGCHNSRDQQGLFCQFTSLFIVIIQYCLNMKFELSFLLRFYKFFEA